MTEKRQIAGQFLRRGRAQIGQIALRHRCQSTCGPVELLFYVPHLGQVQAVLVDLVECVGAIGIPSVVSARALFKRWTAKTGL